MFKTKQLGADTFISIREQREPRGYNNPRDSIEYQYRAAREQEANVNWLRDRWKNE